jgi:hypothetical protein
MSHVSGSVTVSVVRGYTKTIKKTMNIKMSTYKSVGLTTTTAVPLGQVFSPVEEIKSTPVLFELHTASALFVKNVWEMTDNLV